MSYVQYEEGSFTEDDDISSVLAYQQEINRLHGELELQRAETARWRNYATKLKNSQEGDGFEVDKGEDSCDVLKDRLQQERYKHQHDVAVLENIHREKLEQLKSFYEKQLLQLGQHRQQYMVDGSCQAQLDGKPDKLVAQLQDDRRKLESELERSNAARIASEKSLEYACKTIEDNEAILNEVVRKNREELIKRDASELEDNVHSELLQQLSEGQQVIQKLQEENEALNRSLLDLDTEHEEIVRQLVEHRDALRQENAKLLDDVRDKSVRMEEFLASKESVRLEESIMQQKTCESYTELMGDFTTQLGKPMADGDDQEGSLVISDWLQGTGSEYQTLQEELRLASEKCVALEIEVKRAEHECQGARDELMEVRQKLSALQQDEQHRTRREISLENRCTEVNSRLVMMEEEKLLLSSCLTKLKSTISAVNLELDSLKVQLENKDHELQQEKNHQEALQLERDAISEELNETRGYIVLLNEERRQLQQVQSELRGSVEQLRLELSKPSDPQTAVLSMPTPLQHMLDISTHATDDTCSTVQTEVYEQQLLDYLDPQMLEAPVELTAAGAPAEPMNALQLSLAETQELLAQKILFINDVYGCFSSEDYSGHQDEPETGSTSLIEKIRSLQQRAGFLKDQNALQQTQISTLLPTILSLNEQLSDLQGKYSTCNVLLLEKDLQLEKLFKEMQSLSSQLSQKDTDLSTLQDNANRKDAELSTLQDNINRKDTELSSLQENINRKDSELSTLQDNINRKDTELRTLQDNIKRKDVELLEMMELKRAADLNLENILEQLKRAESRSQEDEVKMVQPGSAHSNLESIVSKQHQFLLNFNKRVVQILGQVNECYSHSTELSTVNLAAKHLQTLEEFLNEKFLQYAEYKKENEELRLQLTRLQTITNNLKAEHSVTEKFAESVSSPAVVSSSVTKNSKVSTVHTTQSPTKHTNMANDGELADEMNTNEGLTDEIKEMRKLISEKDVLITELRMSVISLNDALSVYADQHTTDTKIRDLHAEKDQILAILNEKVRENSLLKGEVRSLMDSLAERRSSSDSDDSSEMHRQAVLKLSALVRDKDIEIEALRQKNSSLLIVLQGSQTPDSNQIAQLLEDRQILQQQVALLSAEREQIYIALQAKHQEAIAFHGEATRLEAILASTASGESAIVQSLQQQLTEKQQKLDKCELKLRSVEEQKGLAAASSSFVLQSEESEGSVLKQDRRSHLEEILLEKEKLIEDIQAKLRVASECTAHLESERTTLHRKIDKLSFELSSALTELEFSKVTNVKVASQLSGSDDVIRNLKLSEARLQQTAEELRSQITNLPPSLLSSRNREQSEEPLDEAVVKLTSERNTAKASMVQQQQTILELRSALDSSADRETKLTREIERLRSHLLRIEDAYTAEALESEEREKTLRNRLALAEEQAVSSKTAIQHANLESSRAIEQLEEQLHNITSQKESISTKLALSNEQCNQYRSQLHNLQMVLEQFQKEKDALHIAEVRKFQNLVDVKTAEAASLRSELNKIRSELNDQSEALDAAQRLSLQLDRKEQALAALKEEVDMRTENLKSAEDKIRELSALTEAKVDKQIVKNLLIGYFSCPAAKQKEVLHLIARVLDFSPTENQKMGLEESGSNWVSGLWRRLSTPLATPHKFGGSQQAQEPSLRSLDKSFSELFVKFLESESAPKPTPPALPVERMVEEERRKVENHQKAAFNPFIAPMMTSTPARPVPVSSASSHSLLFRMPPADAPLLTGTSQMSLSSSAQVQSSRVPTPVLVKGVEQPLQSRSPESWSRQSKSPAAAN